jgi:hypothetical protein
MKVRRGAVCERKGHLWCLKYQFGDLPDGALGMSGPQQVCYRCEGVLVVLGRDDH